MKREIRIRTQITVPKWIQFIVKSRAWHGKVWCISKRPVLCDHRQCLTFHERQPLLCFCGKSPTPTDVWTMPQESGQQTEHWMSQTNPHRSNQSICYLTQNSSNTSGINRKYFSWSLCEKRVPCVYVNARCFEHLLPCCFPNIQYGWLLGGSLLTHITCVC